MSGCSEKSMLVDGLPHSMSCLCIEQRVVFHVVKLTDILFLVSLTVVKGKLTASSIYSVLVVDVPPLVVSPQFNSLFHDVSVVL